MRSSLGIRSSNNLITHSQLGGPVNVASIMRPNNSISKQAKFIVADQIQGFEKQPKGMISSSMNGLHYQNYINRDIYYGQHDNGIPHGQGVYIFAPQNDKQQSIFYTGRFQNGQFSGFGKLCRLLNSKQAVYIYQGFWKNGRRQSQGRQYYQDGSYYIGQWANDLFQGPGELFMIGSHYKGLWRQGKMNGEGTMTIESGPFKTVIQGNWQNDNINRGNIKYYAKQTKQAKQGNQLLGEYEGGIQKLQREGPGVYRQGTTIIQGIFLNDELIINNNNMGSIKNKTDKFQYLLKGDLSKPFLNRLQGQIIYSNRDRYQGFFDINNNTLIRTQGRYTFSNGQVHQGYFEDNPQGILRLR